MRSPRAAVREISRETALVVSLISGSQYVNHMYLVVFPPILGILADEFGVTLAALGVALGVQGATNAVCQLPFGHLADSHDRTLALALSSVLGALGVGMLAVAPSYEWLLVGQAVVGVGVAGHHPTHYPLLSDATPERHRGRAFSVYGFGGSLGFATPPVLISAVIAVPALTWRHALGLLSVVGFAYAAVVVGAFLTRVSDEVTTPNRSGEPGGEPLRERVLAEARGLAASPGILLLALLAMITSTASWGFTSYAVVLLTDSYGASHELANLALTGAFVVGAVAILAGGDLSDRIGAGPVMLASFAAVGALLALLALGGVPTLVAVAFVLGVGGVRSLANPARSKLTDDLSARGAIGRNFAVTTIGIMLGSTLAPPLFGYLIESWGYRAAFLAVAAVAFLGVALTAALLSVFAAADSGPDAAAD